MAFSSSAIKKSGKKFAPKAPARRGAAASTTPAPTPASTTSVPISTAGPSLSVPASDNDGEAHKSGKPITSPTSPSCTKEPSLAPPSLTHSSSTAIPIPTPKVRISSSIEKQSATPISAPSHSYTPITIPRPESCPSSHTPIPIPSAVTPILRPTSRSDSHQNVRNTGDSTNIEANGGISRSEDHTGQQRLQQRNRNVERPKSNAKSVPSLENATIPEGAASTNEDSSVITGPAPPAPRRQAKRKRVNASGGILAPRTRRRRQTTPENAADVEITSAAVKMSDLCHDLKTGKTSRREMELRSMEEEESRRKRDQRATGDRTEGALTTEQTNPTPREKQTSSANAAGNMRIVNGQIVVDPESLQIDRHADAARNEDDLEEVVENPLTRKINSASFGKRTKTESWDEGLTDLFYRGLRMFGTDFMMISKMFPGRNRRQIKLKFSNEERKAPERIKQTLHGPPELVDLSAYSELTNTIFDDPKIIQQELDEERGRIEREHAREKAIREEVLRNPSGGDAGGSNIDKNVNKKLDQRRKAGFNKFSGGAEEIVGTI